MITDIEEYFSLGCGRCARFSTPDCSVRQWADGLSALRRLCLGAGLSETVKWGHPCYMHAGRNIAIIGALRGDFRLSFFNAALLDDPAGVLEKSGPNARTPDMLRFREAPQVAASAEAIGGFLEQAKRHAEAGRTAPKPTDPPEWPEELIRALDDDPALAEAFQALTPGRQRSYVIFLNGAKAAKTRTARIMKSRDRIFAGKGANER